MPNLREVRMCASTGGPQSSYEARVTDFTIRAESFANLDEFQAGPGSPVRTTLLWLVAISLLLCVLGGWLWIRRRRRASGAAAARKVPAPPS
jgi:hypothetical protein